MSNIRRASAIANPKKFGRQPRSLSLPSGGHSAPSQAGANSRRQSDEATPGVRSARRPHHEASLRSTMTNDIRDEHSKRWRLPTNTASCRCWTRTPRSTGSGLLTPRLKDGPSLQGGCRLGANAAGFAAVRLSRGARRVGSSAASSRRLRPRSGCRRERGSACPTSRSGSRGHDEVWSSSPWRPPR